MLVINWITSMENIIDKFCKILYGICSNRDFTGIGKRIGKHCLKTTNPSFILAIRYLCLKQLTKVAPSLLPPQVKETDLISIIIIATVY